MAKLTAVQREALAKLEARYSKAKHAYYNGTPSMSDTAFDSLEDKIRELKPNSPVLKAIGAPVVGPDVKLPYPIFSLDKVKTNAGDWLEANPGPYNVSDKLDGFSLEIIYSKDGTVQVFTRGNGVMGKNKDFLVPHLNIPKLKMDLAVRCEALMSVAKFKKIGTDYTNARAVMSAVVNRGQGQVPLDLIPSVDVVALEILSETNKLGPTAQKARLKKLGFNTVWNLKAPVLSAAKLSKLLTLRKSKSRYLMDGLVVTVDKPYRRASVGNPDNSVAFKEVQGEDVVKAKVIAVVYRVSAHGRMVPRVNVEPTKVSGVTISYFTGFNGKFIKDNKVGPGAILEIERSGDVTPYIRKVLKPASKWQEPDIPYKWNASKVDIVVDKDADGSETAVSDQKVMRLVRFFGHLEFDGLRVGTIAKLFAIGLTSPSKIIRAQTHTLMKAEGIKDQSAMKLRQAIKDGLAKTYTWSAIGSASGYFGIGLGETKLLELEHLFPNWKALGKLTPAALKAKISEVPGFQSVTIAKFVTGLPKLLKFVEAVPELKIKAYKEKAPVKGVLTGVSVIMTGFRSKTLSELIVENGGSEVSTVGKATVVIASNPNSGSGKIGQATAKGIPVMKPDEFMRKYKL